jgi:PAS domain S-box-containing protein
MHRSKNDIATKPPTHTAGKPAIDSEEAISNQPVGSAGEPATDSAREEAIGRGGKPTIDSEEAIGRGGKQSIRRASARKDSAVEQPVRSPAEQPIDIGVKQAIHSFDKNGGAGRQPIDSAFDEGDTFGTPPIGNGGESPSALAEQQADLIDALRSFRLYRETFSRHIEELRATRRLLDESRARQDDMLGCAPLAFLLVTADGRIQTINTAGAKLLGAPMSSLLDQPLARFFPQQQQQQQQQQLAEHLRACVETGQCQICESELCTRDGLTIPVLMTSRPSPYRSPRGRMIRMGITDISAHKQRETRLQQYALDLQDANASLELRSSQLQRLSMQLCNAEQVERHRIADLLHDHVQQILVACKMSVDVIVAESPDIAPKASGITAMLQDAISELRSLSMQLRPPALREQGLIVSLRWLVKEMSSKHGLTIHLNADAGIEQLPYTMHDQLYQIVRELLFNVVKHAQADEAEVLLRIDPESKMLTTIVRDRGRGMDVASALTSTGHSGLAHARERAAAFGGQLEIESKPEHGTTVTLRFPLDLAGAEQAEVKAGDSDAPTSSADTIRVLIADDHLIVRQGLVMLLAREPNIEVIGQANSGEEALELARHHIPDVVLMDVSMPVMDGIEATRRIKAEFPHIGVVGLSMHGEDEMAHAIRDAGADDYVSKVAPSEELVGAIRNSLSLVA